jgi:hypothetical protein
MTSSRLITAFRLTALTLLRNRVALVLFVLLPVLFYVLILITTTDAPVTFLLPAVSASAAVEVSRRDEALVFMGLAAVGFVSGFLGLYLINRQAEVNRRLLLCGYRASQLVIARLLVLGCAVALVSTFSGLLLLCFFSPRHLATTVLGFVLVGFVYGCYGLLAGSIFKRELEGVLSIVLLANVDVAWLQNPIFYSESKNKLVIRFLPAHFPSQVSMIGAFSDHAVRSAVGVSLAYGSLLLALAVLVFWWRMHVVSLASATRPG